MALFTTTQPAPAKFGLRITDIASSRVVHLLAQWPLVRQDPTEQGVARVATLLGAAIGEGFSVETVAARPLRPEDALLWFANVGRSSESYLDSAAKDAIRTFDEVMNGLDGHDLLKEHLSDQGDFPTRGESLVHQAQALIRTRWDDLAKQELAVRNCGFEYSK